MRSRLLPLMALLVILILPLPASTGISAAQPALPPLQEKPPPPTEEVAEAVQAAARVAARRGGAYLVYETRLEDIAVSDDGAWATAMLVPVDPETGQDVPAEPGLAISRRERGQWLVYLPGDEGWADAVLAASPDTLTDEAKAYWLELDAIAAEEVPDGPLGGYLLPWAKGQRLFMTQSVAHDRYTPSLTAHYAFDFAAPWDDTNTSPMFNLYASKAGTVKYWVDHWENGHWNPANPNEANYLVLEDTTTSPTTYQLYLHLAQNSIPDNLKVAGASVQQGQFIGIADDTGVSSGNHLHFHVHTTTYSYWGRSVDITFDDVLINGGRPRISIDLPYCRNDDTYQDVCNQTQSTYISGNTVRGDVLPPLGDIIVPAADGFRLEQPTLRLEGYATDDDSGLKSARFTAYFNNDWQPIGPEFSTRSFAYTWDLCSSRVPDGPVSVALVLEDNAGNRSLDLPGLTHFTKDYTCVPSPPACQPTSNQVALFSEPVYQGVCTLFGVGEYTSLGAVGAQNAESLLIGSSVSATLYAGSDLTGRGQTFIANDANLSDDRIGANAVHSLRVRSRTTTPNPPKPVWPPNGYANLDADRSLTLAWDDGGGGTEYQVSITPPAASASLSTWSSEPRYPLVKLLQGIYSWQVRSRIGAYTSPWSTSSNFTVGPMPDIYEWGDAPFSDDFEGADKHWENSNLWDEDDSYNHTPGGSIAWWYGVDSMGNYNTPGVPNAGDLTTPQITIPGSGYVFQFWYRYATEGPGIHWDQRKVQISVDGGPFTDILQLSADPPNYWLQSPPVDLSSYGGHTVRLRFHFETLDASLNTYGGWWIDDISVTKQTLATCSEAPEPVVLDFATPVEASFCPQGDTDLYKLSGRAGDQVGAWVRDLPGGAALDTTLTLLDTDGRSVLAWNDDLVLYEVTDSFVGYRLLADGDYYLRVQAWDHPSAGGEDYAYSLRLARDSQDPVVALTFPTSGTFLPVNPFQVTADAIDATGVAYVTFLYHKGDWANEDWEVIALDADPSDGWSATFDPTSIPNQSGQAFYALAYDLAGNVTGDGAWGLAWDNTPPVTSMSPLPATSESTALRLSWTSSDNLAGLLQYDLQSKVDSLAWTNWGSPLPAEQNAAWAVVEKGHQYSYRMRGVDRVGNTEAYPTAAEATTLVPSTLCSFPDSYESDGSMALATVVEMGFHVQEHNFCNPVSGSNGENDEDWLRVDLSAGDLLIAQVHMVDESAAVVIELRAPDGSLLASAQSPDWGEDAYLFWRASTDGSYYLRLRHPDGRVQGEGVRYQAVISAGGAVYMPLMHKN